MIVLCILCIVSCSIVFTFYCYVMHCCTVYGQSVEGLHGLRHDDQILKSEVFLTNSKGIRAPLAPACPPPPWKRAGGQLPPCPRGVGVPDWSQWDWWISGVARVSSARGPMLASPAPPPRISTPPATYRPTRLAPLGLGVRPPPSVW